MARWLFVMIVVAAIAGRSEAGPRVVIDGDACPRDDIANRLDASGGADVDIHIIVVRDVAAKIHTEIRVAQGGEALGERTFDAPTCEAAVDSIRLVVAMALSAATQEPVRVRAAPRQRRDRDEPPLHALVANDDETAPREAGPPERVGLLGGIATGNRGIEGLAGVRIRVGARAAIGIEVAYGNTEATTPIAMTTTTTIAHTVGTLVGCWRWPSGRSELSACATFAAGVVGGRTDGIAMSTPTQLPDLALGARAEWQHGLAGPLALALRAEVAGALARDRFLVDKTVVWETQPVTGRLGIVLVAQFR